MDCTHLVLQGAILWFIYRAYDADDLKTLILLALLFVWRSVKYLQGQQRIDHERFVLLWRMTHPDVDETYFTTERFAGDIHSDRVWKHLTDEDKR